MGAEALSVGSCSERTQRMREGTDLEGERALSDRDSQRPSLNGAVDTVVMDDDSPDDLSEVMDYSSYDLRTTVRLIVMSGESRRVDVKRGSKLGSIHIRQGEIYRAETTEGFGDEAFFDIMSWDRTIHTDSRQPTPPEKNIRIPTAVILDLLQKG